MANPGKGVRWTTQHHNNPGSDTVRAVIIYVTGILALWRVIDSWMSWECLCGHSVCEWCSCPPPAPSWLYGDAWTETDMYTRYDLPRSQLGND